jgi:hypothetical protein
MAVLAALVAGPASVQSALPDPSRTPGAVNQAVTQETIGLTICIRRWTRTVRPPWQYTSALKRRQIRECGYEDRRMADYEEDHLVPLSTGGSPDDPDNLWPEPFVTADGWDAVHKNQLEITLDHLVCAGRLTLDEAQHAIATDWIAAYRRFVAE